MVVEGEHNGFFSRWGSKPEDLGSLQSKSGTSIIIYMVILWVGGAVFKDFTVVQLLDFDSGLKYIPRYFQ